MACPIMSSSIGFYINALAAQINRSLDINQFVR
jgi:hypothetical protein